MAKETFDRNYPRQTPTKPPPPPPPPDGLTITTTAGVLTTMQFDFTTSDEPDGYYAIEATQGMSQGITSVPKSRLKLIASIQNNLLSDVLSFVSEYSARFGFVEVGATVWVRLYYINSVSGQRWTLGTYSAIVGGT